MRNFSNRMAMAVAAMTLTVATPMFTVASVAAVPGQPVDLTYAAEKAPILC